MATDRKVVVCGAGGFIGGHLVADLLRRGVPNVRAVDAKPPDAWLQRFDAAENVRLDLAGLDACRAAVRDARVVYNLAADMGGMGYITGNRCLCMLSVLINTHLCQAARDEGGVDRFFFASSACVYNTDKQNTPGGRALREDDAYPALPEDGYGWEKLFSERMCRHFREDFGLQTRVARFHNVYGPHVTYDGGREMAAAAICRKVAAAKLSGRHEIDIWGDGTQTRSFMYVADCVTGIQMITHDLDAAGRHAPVLEPINLGSSQPVSIDQLVDVVAEVAGIRLERRYNPSAPRGVTGRSSDNTRIRQLLGWEPDTPLRDGMERTYAWVYDQMAANR